MIAASGPFHAVHLVGVVSKLLPGWLEGRPRILAALRARWAAPERAARVEAEATLTRCQLLEGKRLAKSILRHVCHTRQGIPALLDLYSFVLVRGGEEGCKGRMFEGSLRGNVHDTEPHRHMYANITWRVRRVGRAQGIGGSGFGRKCLGGMLRVWWYVWRGVSESPTPPSYRIAPNAHMRRT